MLVPYLYFYFRVQLCNLNGHPSAYMPKFGYQLHVSFISHTEINKFVTEEFLRIVFEPFGEVVDALLARHFVSQNPPKQNGYGFVYMGTEQGATTAIASLHHVEVDGFKFDCTISHRSVAGSKDANSRHSSHQPQVLQAIAIPVPAIFSGNNQANHNNHSQRSPQQQQQHVPQSRPANNPAVSIPRKTIARLMTDEDIYRSSSGSPTTGSPSQTMIPVIHGNMQYAPPPQVYSPTMYHPASYGTPPQSPRYDSPPIQYSPAPQGWIDQSMMAPQGGMIYPGQPHAMPAYSMQVHGDNRMHQVYQMPSNASPMMHHFVLAPQGAPMMAPAPSSPHNSFYGRLPETGMPLPAPIPAPAPGFGGRPPLPRTNSGSSTGSNGNRGNNRGSGRFQAMMHQPGRSGPSTYNHYPSSSDDSM